MNSIATFFRESRVGRFFIPLGIILIVLSIFMFIIDEKNKDYIKTDAIVSRTELVEEAHTDSDGNQVEATYKVYIKYIVDEKQYDVEFGEFSEYKTGDKISITYNPKDPSQISQSSSVILKLAILLVGIASLVGGIISIINAVKRQKKMKLQEEAWSNDK